MRSKVEKHLANAISEVHKANREMEKRVNEHEKILQSHAQEIGELQQQVLQFRDNAIRSDLDAGLSGREVASKYSLSPGRISQIKNQ